VGVQFGLSIFLLTLLGVWLDSRLGTRPLFTIVLLLLGFAGATYSLVRQVLGPNDKK
jgi:F0F1-type ATP synthase assembly protein I